MEILCKEHKERISTISCYCDKEQTKLMTFWMMQIQKRERD